MPTTPTYGFQYPASTDTPDVPYWQQQLAQDVETAVTSIDNRVVAVEDKGFVYKSADESVTNSTTLQNDNHLLFTASAGKKYYFEIQLVTTCPSSGIDMKVGLTFPAGSLSYTVTGMDPAVGSGYIGSGTWAGYDSTTVSASNSVAVGIPATTTPNSGFVKIVGVFICTTGGTVQLQWTQNTLSASALVVKTGSFLKWEVVA